MGRRCGGGGGGSAYSWGVFVGYYSLADEHLFRRGYLLEGGHLFEEIW